MRTLAVLPIKSFGSGKSRLASALGSAARRALAEAMFRDTLASLSRVPGLAAVAVVSSDRGAVRVAGALGATVLRDDREAGHNPAARIGVHHALASGFERVLLVPGDTPLLDPRELAGLLAASGREPGVAVIPDRHGSGTNGLLIAPPDALEPSFGPGSLRRHVQAAAYAGLRHSVEALPSLGLDVDTPEDLAELRSLLAAEQLTAPMTHKLLCERDPGRRDPAAA